MDFALSEEQLELQRSARQFLAERYPIERVAEAADGDGFDRSGWKEIAGLGWTGISVPEERGGSGLSFVDEVLLAEELGRCLFSGPFLSSVTVATRAILSGGASDLL